ncbi:hypothetical protein BU17DRAFT_58995 [Hysterangium stoloniferum]|nr:hypothetical protein BU17DRAFT_58995 [Hysterangium stoloniferum]
MPFLSKDLFEGLSNLEFQDVLVKTLLHSPPLEQFPPSPESRHRFWKWVVTFLETITKLYEEQEVDERIYEACLDSLATRSFYRSATFALQPPSPAYCTYFWHIRPENIQSESTLRTTTLLESRTLIEGGTTGFRTWRASLVFADWLRVNPDVVQNRRVLELGSGIGFLGLVVADLQLDANPGSYSLTMTDVHSEVLSRCRDNFQLSCNNMNRHSSLDFCLLDWFDALQDDSTADPNSVLNQILIKSDIIIGADLVYDTSVLPALSALFVKFFLNKNSVVKTTSRRCTPCIYIALTVRQEQTFSAFTECLGACLICFIRCIIKNHI